MLLRVAFPKNLLNEGEEIVLDLRPHWLYLMKSGATLFAVVIVGLLVMFGWQPTGGTWATMRVLLGVALLGSLGWFGWTYVRWTTTMFVLTTDRLISRSGVVSKSGIDVPLERVNTVFFSQSVIERVLGAGDLSIESAGERGTNEFHDIRKPSIVQKEIYVQIEANENRKFDRMRGPGGTVGGGDATTPLPPGIPEQIEQLAELHQRGVLSDSEFARKKAELLDRM